MGRPTSLPGTVEHVPISPNQDRALAALAQSQAGVVSTGQLSALGISSGTVRAQIRARRWRRVHPGVHATFTGPIPDLARVWAALLYAGEHAVASHQTAEWLAGLRDDLPPRVTVSVPHGQRLRSRPSVSVRQSRHLQAKRHPARIPPQTTVEDTVLDLVDDTPTERQVIDLVLRVCQQRRTSVSRLMTAAAGRSRLRWRALVRDLLRAAGEGVASPLERCYVRDVERAHGLPRGWRNLAEGRRGHRRYRDVRYRRWSLVVELDGRAAHPEDERELDDLRDNEVAERRERTLRYGWRSVTCTPCHVGRQVCAVLRQGGWTGQPVRCGPGCTIDLDSSSLEVIAVVQRPGSPPIAGFRGTASNRPTAYAPATAPRIKKATPRPVPVTITSPSGRGTAARVTTAIHATTGSAAAAREAVSR